MPSKKASPFISIITVYGLIALIAIFALIMAIKTNQLNKSISELDKEIAVLENENRKLNLNVLSKSTYPKLEQKAAELGLKAPKKVDYLYLKPQKDTHK